MLRSFYSEYMQNHKNRCINSPSRLEIAIFCHFSVIFYILITKNHPFWAFYRFLTIKYNYRHFGVVICLSFAVITTIIVVFSDFLQKNTKKQQIYRFLTQKRGKSWLFAYLHLWFIIYISFFPTPTTKFTYLHLVFVHLYSKIQLRSHVLPCLISVSPPKKTLIRWFYTALTYFCIIFAKNYTNISFHCPDIPFYYYALATIHNILLSTRNNLFYSKTAVLLKLRRFFLYFGIISMKIMPIITINHIFSIEIPLITAFFSHLMFHVKHS